MRMSTTSARHRAVMGGSLLDAVLLAVLVLSAPSAFGGTVGVPSSGSLQSLRVGPSTHPLATYDGVALRISSHRSVLSRIQDVFVRTGAVHVGGAWTVTACVPDCATSQRVQQAGLQSNVWNQVTFSPPLSVPANSVAEIFLRPQITADADFIVNSQAPLSSSGTPRMGEPAWGQDFELGMQFGNGNTWHPSGVVFVFTLAGEVDALAPASCQGADRIAVQGQPYIDAQLVTNTSGASLAQGFFRLAYSGEAAQEELDAVQIPAVGSTSTIPFDITGPSIPVRTGVLDGGYAVLDSCLPTEPWSSSLELETIALQPAGSASWLAAVANPGSLPLCHPVARATYGGSAASAWIGGIPDPALDFVFRYETGPLSGWHLDADGDGHGSGPVAGYCLPRLGYAPSPDDCDDARADVFPGAPELCDGVANACDGQVDAEKAALVLDRCANQQGVCEGSLHESSQCVDGGWTSCVGGDFGASFEPVEASCDGLDNDCDGELDEALPSALCPKQKGVCAGAQAPGCVAGVWAACNDVSYGFWFEPKEVSCDGLDNDCDGLTDGKDPDVKGPPCELEFGVCHGAVHGGSRCGVEGWSACEAADYGPHFEAAESSCDGLDNDCDGWVDQFDPGMVAPRCENQQGVCQGSLHSLAECSAGGWTPCTAADFGMSYAPDERACDGLDNDCDGTIDEGCDKVATGCAVPGGGAPAGEVWPLVAAAGLGLLGRQWRHPAGRVSTLARV